MKYIFLVFLVSCSSKSIHEKKHDEWMKLADSISAQQKVVDDMINRNAPVDSIITEYLKAHNMLIDLQQKSLDNIKAMK